MKYICSCCGEEHDEWPALTYSSPVHYNDLTREEKERIGALTPDFCTITYTEQIDRFIRCNLTIRVMDHCEDLVYGLWVSLSEKSFEDYRANFDNENHEVQYFGWLSNQLPDYPDSTQIPTTVVTQTMNQRPTIVPHENFDHPFVKDYYEGITKVEAERRINQMLRTEASSR